MTKRAAFIMQKDGKGDGRVYIVDPPHEGYGFVWVSAVNAFDTGPETYIFGCDEEGEVSDWGELPGSFKGDLDHEAALRAAGYEVVE